MKALTFGLRRTMVIMLTAALMLVTGPFVPAYQQGAYADSVDTWAALVEAVDTASDGDTIIITGDIVINEGDDTTGSLPTTLTIDKNITIVGADGGATISRKGLQKRGTYENEKYTFNDEDTYELGPMISVESGELTLGENITFSGKRISNPGSNNLDAYWWESDFIKDDQGNLVTRGFFVEVGENGSLEIDGANFEDYWTWFSWSYNKDYLPAGVSPIFVAGNFSMKSGTISNNNAGGVYKENGKAPSPSYCGSNSFLTHEDGSQAGLNGADNVIASGSDWTVSQTTAGGIFIDAPGKNLEITGGTIVGNKGNTGGIAVAGGSLTIKGGTISNGWGDHFAGGLYIVSEDAEVRMCGGVIENCESNMGGGVLPTNNASFFLMGGTITNNKSYINGGGVLVYSDRVYLLSGTISNNASSTFGGGVYVYGNDKNIEQQYVMTLHNAQITGNEAVGTATDSRIKGTDQAARVNTSADTFLSGSGGGVWLCPAGVSEFDASTLNIYENTAAMQGDDFHKDAGFDGGVLLDFGPHEELDEWEHQELEGPKGNYVDSEKKKNKQKLTVAEATSGSNGSISLVHLDKTQNLANSLLRVENNVSLRGGGIGSNGVVIFSKDAKNRNIDKGELEFEKTFTDLPEKPMEYDMIAADENGNPKKDSKGNDVVIMTFRLFDANYSSNYDDLRVNPNAKEFGQLSAKWNDDNSKVTIQFPEGNDDVSFFKGSEIQPGDELKVIFKEFEVNNNKRGKQVSERIFSFDTPEFQEAETLVDRKIDIYPGGHCTQEGQQGCDEWSCDPGKPETFELKYRKYNFDAAAVNKKAQEYEILISKTTLDGKNLHGAELEIIDSDGEKIADWTSGDEPKKLNLMAGTYVLVEKAAPEGFNKINTRIEFEVDDSGNVQLLTEDLDIGGKIEVDNGNHILLSDAQKATISKTVNDKKYHEIKNGEEIINYTIKAKIGYVPDKSFVITDDVPGELLIVDPDNITILVNDDALSADEVSEILEVNGNTVTVSPTLEMMEEWGPFEMSVLLSCMIRDDADVNGKTIKNTAELVVDGESIVSKGGENEATVNCVFDKHSEPVEEPDDDKPDKSSETGDATSLLAGMILLMLSAATASILAIRRRRMTR